MLAGWRLASEAGVGLEKKLTSINGEGERSDTMKRRGRRVHSSVTLREGDLSMKYAEY